MMNSIIMSNSLIDMFYNDVFTSKLCIRYENVLNLNYKVKKLLMMSPLRIPD